MTRNFAFILRPVLFMLFALGGVMPDCGQTLINLGSQGRNADFTAQAYTRPIKTGASLPATCTTGDMYFNLIAPAGKNLYACTTTNTWTLESSSSGGGTLTNFSLASPGFPSSLLSCTVTNPTTTPVLTCSYATGQTANQIVGTNNSGNVGLMSLTTAQLPSAASISTYLNLGALSTAAYPAAGIVKSSGSAFSVAVPGTDYVVPSGNVATASALAAAPTLCGSGQAAQGILTNGNATGCFTPGAAGGGGMAYPSAGIGVSMGSGWGSSIVYCAPGVNGIIGDGATDDTVAMQNCLNQALAVYPATSGRIRVGPGTYKISSTLSIYNAYQFVLEGSGSASKFVWYGNSTSPMFELDNDRDFHFAYVYIIVGSSSYPLQEGIRVANGAGGLSNILDPGHGTFDHVVIQGTAGYIKVPIRLGPISGSDSITGGTYQDANNDLYVFKADQLNNYSVCGVSIEGTQSHNIEFDQVEMQSDGYGQYGICGALNGSVGEQANFMWHGGYMGANTSYDFFLGPPQALPVSIDGLSSENSCGFVTALASPGSTSYHMPIIIRNNRWADNAACASGATILYFGWPGPITLEDNSLGSSTSTAKYINWTPGTFQDLPTFRAVNNIMRTNQTTMAIFNSAPPTYIQRFLAIGSSSTTDIGSGVVTTNTSYSMASGDVIDTYIGTSCTSACTIALPNIGYFSAYIPLGKTYTIKDQGGTAATNNVTVSCTTTTGNSCTIDGASAQTISTNYGELIVAYLGGINGNTWSIVGKK